MAEKKKRNSRLRLAMMFAVIVFLIILLTITAMFFAIVVLQRFGIRLLDESARTPLFAFALVSLCIGTVFAFLLSNIPLKPIHIVCEAADKIADGDYSVRIKLDGSAEFTQLADSFNHMAAELGSVEMLRSDFVNNVSHEFKTPIVSIRGFAKLLKRDDLTEEERTEYLDTIITESERLAELSTSILNLTKIEQQTIITDKKCFNVSEQIRLVVAMLYDKWQAKQLTFDFDYGEIYLAGNEKLMKQIWINLLDNAIKFSPVGGTIIIKLKRSVQSVIISFTNEGEVMTEEQVAHIFDKFYQVDKPHAASGYGIGLAIVKRIVELHNGNVTVTTDGISKITFHVKIPN